MNTPKIGYTGEILEDARKGQKQIETQHFSEKQLKWRTSFGISHPTLKRFKVYSCKNIFLNCNFFANSTDAVPMYGYYGGKKDGIEYWRIYMPTKKSYRFLSNWSKNMIQGAHMLPESGELVVITKSMKDVMLLYELGIPAIAPTSESTFLSKLQLEKLKNSFKNVLLFYYNDLA